MCGIFCLLNNNKELTNEFIEQQFKKGKSRGPENSKLMEIDDKTLLGFHRLAINGINDKSNQPMKYGYVNLVCNGEIYNHKELYNLINFKPLTDSDCEIIIHLYIKYGIEYTLQLLDGVFAFVLIDTLKNELYAARDPYGVRPLYQSCNDEYHDHPLVFASELKVLQGFINYHYKSTCCTCNNQAKQFEPGTYSKFKLSNHKEIWYPVKENIIYHTFGFKSILNSNNDNMYEIYKNIQSYLIEAVKKRCLNTERPIACLLSGGLDSSLITALVNECISTEGTLETYSIGLKGSEDLKYAKTVANYLKTKHNEILLQDDDFFNAIPEVIYAIESYDTTTVRASIGNYLVSKYISQNSNAKVIFNGDGSDEACGGYLYFHMAPDCLEFDRECRRLLKDIHLYDVLRSDKSISSNGLEPRTPFLDRSFIQYYLSIHLHIPIININL